MESHLGGGSRKGQFATHELHVMAMDSYCTLRFEKKGISHCGNVEAGLSSEAHFYKKKLNCRGGRNETNIDGELCWGGGGLLENGRSEQLEILATDTRVKLVYDTPHSTPPITF